MGATTNAALSQVHLVPEYTRQRQRQQRQRQQRQRQQRPRQQRHLYKRCGHRAGLATASVLERTMSTRWLAKTLVRLRPLLLVMSITSSLTMVIITCVPLQPRVHRTLQVHSGHGEFTRRRRQQYPRLRLPARIVCPGVRLIRTHGQRSVLGIKTATSVTSCLAPAPPTPAPP